MNDSFNKCAAEKLYSRNEVEAVICNLEDASYDREDVSIAIGNVDNSSI